MTGFIWKILETFWPFLWEMVIGKKTFLEAIHSNKKAVFLVIMITGSFGLNIWQFIRLVSISSAQIHLAKVCKPELVSQSPAVVYPKQESAPVAESPTQDNTFNAVEDQMLKLRDSEKHSGAR
jgi:hypothetical protein